ncbi:hypothetical protein BCR35DRAFT_310051 [Leucosporidium creatinivorum]|uniref:Uncharacterized protein n=1 Tax=Leucosporidium creatinivorum TaxID=106004 RepID=A0A1Y2D8G0_9BASI|nr:hypothetical protein BCR35DRAFT_310051 [Leucosporidium creatinivorum]
MSPSPKPSPPPRADGLQLALSSPSLLLDYTRLLLRSRGTSSPTPTIPPTTEPLAVLLCLLEGLVYLKASTELDHPPTASDREAGAGGASTSSHYNTAPDAAGKATQTVDPRDGGLSAEETSTRPGWTSSNVAQAHAEEVWEDWSDYMAEVYLYPIDSAPSPSSSSSTSSWTSPLFISSSDIPDLATLVRKDTFDSTTHSLLLSVCTSAITYLAAHPLSPSTFLSPPELLTKLLAQVSAFPPRAPNILSTISSTLSSQRRASGVARSCPSTRTFRYTLAEVLQHFFGASFRPVQVAGGDWAYAQEKEDDEAIKKMYPERGDSSLDEDEEEEETVDRESGVRAATLSIHRRDDKMRWVFGDDFQQKSLPNSRPSSPTPPTSLAAKRSSIGRISQAIGLGSSSHYSGNDLESLNSSVIDSPPSKSKSRRPVSMSSFESNSAISSSHDDHTHRRVTSTSSSNSPLIEPPSPSSPNRIPLHRRGVSTGGIALASSRGFSSKSPYSPTAPFGNLAEVDHYPISDSSSPVGSPTRRVSLDSARLPPTTNALSALDRKELVKRSRKLEQMFGVPMEEEAVEKVLLKGQHERRQSSAEEHHQKMLPRKSTPTRPMTLPGRSRSFSHQSPSSPADDDSNDLALPLDALQMVRSHSSPGGTPSASRHPPSPTESYFPTASRIHNAMAYSALGGTPEQQKEERRKKLAKLQRLLGEKVPAEIALSDSPGRGAGGGAASMGRSASRLGGMLRGKGFGRGKDKEKGGRKEEELVVVERQEMDSGSTSSRESGRHKALEPLNSMSKARKLENLFGDLPPKSLFSHAQRDHDRDTRRDSDASVLTRATSTRTIDSYRNSIASLQHLVEADPEALDAIVEIYADTARAASTDELGGPAIGESSARTEESTPEKEGSEVELTEATRKAEDSSPPPPIPSTTTTAPTPLLPSSSSPELPPSPTPPPPSAAAVSLTRPRSLNAPHSHSRTSRRATKLSQFFGTTRGEVWGMLLDDLQSAIEEEEDLDEEERSEVLGGVSRLRESTVVSPGAGSGCRG